MMEQKARIINRNERKATEGGLSRKNITVNGGSRLRSKLGSKLRSKLRYKLRSMSWLLQFVVVPSRGNSRRGGSLQHHFT